MTLDQSQQIRKLHEQREHLTEVEREFIKQMYYSKPNFELSKKQIEWIAKIKPKIK